MAISQTSRLCAVLAPICREGGTWGGHPCPSYPRIRRPWAGRARRGGAAARSCAWVTSRIAITAQGKRIDRITMGEGSEYNLPGLRRRAICIRIRQVKIRAQLLKLELLHKNYVKSS
jgi:hypothetical protein